jgi:hypothetical protein
VLSETDRADASTATDHAAWACANERFPRRPGRPLSMDRTRAIGLPLTSALREKRSLERRNASLLLSHTIQRSRRPRVRERSFHERGALSQCCRSKPASRRSSSLGPEHPVGDNAAAGQSGVRVLLCLRETMGPTSALGTLGVFRDLGSGRDARADRAHRWSDHGQRVVAWRRAVLRLGARPCGRLARSPPTTRSQSELDRVGARFQAAPGVIYPMPLSPLPGRPALTRAWWKQQSVRGCPGGRIGPAPLSAGPSSEPDVRLSPHPAQARPPCLLASRPPIRPVRGGSSAGPFIAAISRDV